MRRVDAVAVMAKAPRPGTAKTRMIPSLGADGAAALALALLLDTIDEVSAVPDADLALFFTPDDAAPVFDRAVKAGFHLWPQSGADLGERMSAATHRLRLTGLRNVAIIGTDCPALSASRIRDSLDILSSGIDAVFGPAVDGGFYLAAFAIPCVDIFSGIPWSTRGTLDAVLERCRSLGVGWRLLPVERDIDEPADLAPALDRMRVEPHPSSYRTRAILTSSSPARAPMT